MIKRIAALLLAALLLAGCNAAPSASQEGGIAATTAPVAQFARAVTEGTGVPVTQIVTDSVSCLHDYSLSVRQMEAVEKSRVVLCSGAGLEDFMADVLENAAVVDCSQGVTCLENDEGVDPHIWLDPDRAAQMVQNMAAGLSGVYPQYADRFQSNADALCGRLADLKAYGQSALADLACRELITFHDGFAYFAEAFDLELLAAIEEEAGSETSARELSEIIGLVEQYGLPAIFTEVNGSDSAASILERETGVRQYALDTAMGGSDYFDAMTHNFDILKEALQ